MEKSIQKCIQFLNRKFRPCFFAETVESTEYSPALTSFDTLKGFFVLLY